MCGADKNKPLRCSGYSFNKSCGNPSRGSVRPASIANSRNILRNAPVSVLDIPSVGIK